MSKEIVDAFIYAGSAYELWTELEERFGESNGPFIYQLEREITSISQGNHFVVMYYTRLKKLWEEHSCLVPVPQCTCAAAKEMVELDVTHKLMQFLIGLNESFDHIRNQILVMDPLPSLNRAYSLVLRVEKERVVQFTFPEMTDNSTILVRSQNCSRGCIGSYGRGENSNSDRRRGNCRLEYKAIQHCNYFNKDGHLVETCFELHGYPEWYVQLKEQKGKSKPNSATANMAESPFEIENDTTELDAIGITPQNIDIANIIHKKSENTCRYSWEENVSKQILPTLQILQDPFTDGTLAIGKMIGKLYLSIRPASIQHLSILLPQIKPLFNSQVVMLSILKIKVVITFCIVGTINWAMLLFMC